MMDRAKRILIAEDEKADVLLMQIALKEFALDDECAVVHDGQEALDYLFCRGGYVRRPQGLPELLLLDLKLPKVSGVEVLRELSRDARFNELAAVVFSSSLDENDRKAALASGARDFMTKPMGFDDFRRAMDKVVSTYLIARR